MLHVKRIIAIGVFGFAAFLVGCESQESDDLAKAQKCLDGIGSTNYASAAACLAPIAKYDSQQANILKCSIKFVAGGLTTNKIVSAYQQLSTASTANKEMVFMTVLALSPSTLATDAQAYCHRSGVATLIYLSDLAVMGSMMSDTLVGLPGSTYNPNDPSYTPPTPTEISNLLDACQPGSPGLQASCTTNYATIGASATAVAQGYCTGANSTSDICSKVNTAIAGAGGDNALIAKQLFCALDNKTYNSGSDNCI